jgi:phenylacetate-CoA ligase
VPAYRDFLKSEGINPSKIKSYEEFRTVTPVDKKNYLSKYPLADLCWDGDLFHNRIISVSSGSTGVPFFWPRGAEQDDEGAVMHEALLRSMGALENKSTLVVICFSMGTWIAGSFTTSSLLKLSERGHQFNIATPGIEKEETLKVIKSLASNYEQIIIAGYPPFVKDVIDEGYDYGIKWRQHKVKLLFAGEAFSEEWRDYVLKRAGSTDAIYDSANIYGSADAAMLGYETPVSIALRRIYNRRITDRRKVFNAELLPALVQYDPQYRFFEEVNGELVFSSWSGIPLVRYNIHDTGGVLTFDQGIAPVRDAFDLAAKKYSLPIEDCSLPFIYLNGRKDFTVTIYAVNIYPENIRAALLDPKMRSWVTGKFTMATKYQSDMNQYFEVNIELAKGIDADDAYEQIANRTLMSKLVRLNGEFRKLNNAIGVKAEPHIHLIEYGNEEYFANGVKHRWVKKHGKRSTV